jgi:alkylation response protein AidB-like acyl-CoA dehydrogenase
MDDDAPLAWLPDRAPEPCPEETDWFGRWSGIAGRAGSPAELAVRGGAAADRPAWIFLSGYQAALAHVFPEAGTDGWSCFAVSEPEEGPSCVVEGTGPSIRLDGAKSWIAGARHVHCLVVSVDGVRRFILVDRNAPGVTLEVRREARFLPELSQGSARFDGVRVDAEAVIDDPARAKAFRMAEPAFVLLALNGFLIAHAGGHMEVNEAGEAALHAGVDLVSDPESFSSGRGGLEAVRSRTQAAVAAFEGLVLPALDTALRENWQRDRRLLRMFGATA